MLLVALEGCPRASPRTAPAAKATAQHQAPSLSPVPQSPSWHLAVRGCSPAGWLSS